MNSRILKKLCKRAEKFSEAFEYLERVDDGSNDPLSILKFDKKHKEKWCRSKTVSSILNKTPCYGACSGGYEPEWEDTPAYFILKDRFFNAFTDWNQDGMIYRGPKRPTPSLVFKHFGI